MLLWSNWWRWWDCGVFYQMQSWNSVRLAIITMDGTFSVSQILPSTVHNSRLCEWTLHAFGSLFTAKQSDGYLRAHACWALCYTCQLCGHGFYFRALRRCCRLRKFTCNQHAVGCAAVRSVLPTASLHHCRFHLRQAWWQSCEQFGSWSCVQGQIFRYSSVDYHFFFRTKFPTLYRTRYKTAVP